MNVNYTIDKIKSTEGLELRVAVALTMDEKYPKARIHHGLAVYGGCNGWVDYIPVFDLSFDAIMPLVRELYNKNNDMPYIYDAVINMSCFSFEFAVFESTPSDYCRAYLTALYKIKNKEGIL